METLENLQVWTAAGILCCFMPVDAQHAVEAITDRASDLNVPAADVAAFVIWCGRLPA